MPGDHALGARKPISWTLFLIISFITLFIMPYTYVSQLAKGQTSSYLVCNLYCAENGISVEYPAGYLKNSVNLYPWFVHFDPTPNSISSVYIYVRYEIIGGSLLTYFLNHVDGIRYSRVYQYPIVSSTPTTTLDGQLAYSVAYAFTNPVSGIRTSGYDVMAVDPLSPDKVYVLSFNDNSASAANDVYVVQHVTNTFHFTS